MPTVKLRVCIICGAESFWKSDRAGRPYLSCPSCNVRIFPHSRASISGIEVVHEMVVRSGINRFRQAVQRRGALADRAQSKRRLV